MHIKNSSPTTLGMCELCFKFFYMFLKGWTKFTQSFKTFRDTFYYYGPITGPIHSSITKKSVSLFFKMNTNLCTMKIDANNYIFTQRRIWIHDKSYST